MLFSLFFFTDTATTEIYTLSLHDALPIFREAVVVLEDQPEVHQRVDVGRLDGGQPAVELDRRVVVAREIVRVRQLRSEEHTSELQSRRDLVCRLLLEKKKKKKKKQTRDKQ